MEKPRIIETFSDRCAETKRRIASFILGKMEAYDDALDVFGDAFDDEESERLVSREELAELEESHIERGRE